MIEAMIHRGPDDSGYWLDADTGVALGHRRLSIIDLSEAGRQPMVSASGRYVISYNGEIYNFMELRRELEKKGHKFRGRSDTEVMLAAFEEWGLERSVKRFAGMFAFALWDTQEKKLHLVRDRLGEKPLYYGWMGGNFLFASELKASRAFSGFSPEIDRNVLTLFLRYCYIPAPYSIYEGIRKLTPGCILTISPRQIGEYPDPVPYWSAVEAAARGTRESFPGSEEEALSELEDLLKNAVLGQMVSDVPLGAFLSGGIDSSTVVALMQSQSEKPVKTFSIGFYEEAYDEARYAREVAEHLGTEHTELYVTPEEAMRVVPLLPTLYDEPFADSSQIPTFLVAGLTRRKVTVSLSGDGGDELFGGYNRYFWAKGIWDRTGGIPQGLRALAASALKLVPPVAWDLAFKTLEPVLPVAFKQRLPGDKIHKLAEMLSARSSMEVYRELVSTWKNPSAVVPGANEPATKLTGNAAEGQDDFACRMMLLDLLTYLPDDILVKVDRACMGVSLESRVPFLDHRVVEFAWKLPLDMKIRGGKGKWILRRLLYKYLPEELVERPKMGFGIPIDRWLRGPLREWAESLLNGERLRREGFFDASLVRKKWQEHLSGRRNWQYCLWNVLMFESWYDRWMLNKGING
jgi:asparagine synthase (glutamine-hydrolysing)